MSDADECDDELIESCMLYGHQVIRRAKYDKLQAEVKRLEEREKVARLFENRSWIDEVMAVQAENKRLREKVWALERWQDSVRHYSRQAAMYADERMPASYFAEGGW